MAPTTDSVSTLLNFKFGRDYMQVHVISRNVNCSTARMVGTEKSFGDWIATIDIEADDPSIGPRLFEVALCKHTEVVLSERGEVNRPIWDALSSLSIHQNFPMLHGFSFCNETPSARLLSRTIVKSLLHPDSQLKALETLAARIDYRKRFAPHAGRKATRRKLGERLKMLNRSAAPAGSQAFEIQAKFSPLG